MNFNPIPGPFVICHAVSQCVRQKQIKYGIKQVTTNQPVIPAGWHIIH